MLQELFVQIVLAFIQGMTEIFPISSSLHILVAGTILGVNLTLDRIFFFTWARSSQSSGLIVEIFLRWRSMETVYSWRYNLQ